MIDYNEGMMEKMEKGQLDHFFPLGQPTLLEVLVGKQQMGPFNIPAAPYKGVEKRKALMKSIEKANSIDSQTHSSDSRDDLKTAAYYLWQSRGCPFNDPDADWREAERQRLSRAKSA